MKTGLFHRIMVRLLFFDWDRGLVPIARRGLFGMRPEPAPPESVEGSLAESVRSFEMAFGYAWSLWLAVAVAAVGRVVLAQYGHSRNLDDAWWDSVIVPYEVVWTVVYLGLIAAAVWLTARSLRAGARATEIVVGVERSEPDLKAEWAAEYAGLDLPYTALLSRHSSTMRAVTAAPEDLQSP